MQFKKIKGEHDIFVKTMLMASPNFEKKKFERGGQSQCDKCIDLGVISKGILSGVCIPNMNSLFYNLKVLAKFKYYQANRQIDGQDKILCPDHSTRRHKISCSNI